jgi:predicted RNA binding protein YcfA (HicA-like mRNA interferase family)
LSRLPVISGRECVRALQRLGFAVVRREGSHTIVRRTLPFAQVVGPDHKTLDRGPLRAIIRRSEISTDEFMRNLAD